MPSRWYAFAALSDARDATEELLRPVDRGRWLRIALIALFVGVGGGVPAGSGNVSTPSGGGGAVPSDAVSSSAPDVGPIAALVVGAVLVVVLLVLLWSLVGAIMEFVLVTGLRDRELSIRASFGANVGPGLRLFGFRLVVGLVTVLVVGVPLLGAFGLGVGVSPALLAFLVPLAVVFGVVALVGSVVLGLTTDFVVPAMLVEGLGVLDGWRRLWPTLRAEWTQIALYVVAKFVLGIAVGLAVSLVVLLAALLVGVPFAVVGVLLYFAAAAAGSTTAGLVVAGLLVALFVLAMIAVGLLVQVPALTFVRYYSLSVLGMLVPDLDLVGVERPGGDGGGGPVAATGGDGDGPDDPSPPADATGRSTAPPPGGARSSR